MLCLIFYGICANVEQAARGQNYVKNVRLINHQIKDLPKTRLNANAVEIATQKKAQVIITSPSLFFFSLSKWCQHRDLRCVLRRPSPFSGAYLAWLCPQLCMFMARKYTYRLKTPVCVAIETGSDSITGPLVVHRRTSTQHAASMMSSAASLLGTPHTWA